MIIVKWRRKLREKYIPENEERQNMYQNHISGEYLTSIDININKNLANK